MGSILINGKQKTFSCKYLWFNIVLGVKFFKKCMVGLYEATMTPWT